MNFNQGIFTLAVTTMLLSSCVETEKPPTGNEPLPETEAIDPATPLIVAVTGKVTEVRFGKDGYTAKLISDKAGEIYATISRANLREPETYREVAVGDTISIIGEEWEMENQTHLTVRELK